MPDVPRYPGGKGDTGSESGRPHYRLRPPYGWWVVGVMLVVAFVVLHLTGVLGGGQH
jgi:hypothetical protein